MCGHKCATGEACVEGPDTLAGARPVHESGNEADGSRGAEPARVCRCLSKQYVDAGIVSFGRLSFRSGGYSDHERFARKHQLAPPVEGRCVNVKLASLRFEGCIGWGGCDCMLLRGLGSLAGLGGGGRTHDRVQSLAL
jgi:hypothetical protein